MKNDNCWLAHILDLDDCDNVIDIAHVGFSEHWLHKAPTGPKLTKKQANDPRILRPVCRAHHTRFDYGKLDIERHDIPASVEGFARQYKLEYKLDKEYPKQGPQDLTGTPLPW